VFITTQLERYDRYVLMSKVFEVLCASAGRRAMIDPDKWDIREQRLIHDDHR
jgi:hypothetical protein